MSLLYVSMKYREILLIIICYIISIINIVPTKAFTIIIMVTIISNIITIIIITITIIIINTGPVEASDDELVGGWSDAARY